MNYENVYTLITGASEGLGKALAIECASRNMNLILAALPGEELDQVVNYITRNYHVKVIAFGTDLSSDGNCEKLLEMIDRENLQVNMLVNNAGIGGTQFFDDTNLDVFEKQIRLNVLTTVKLTHLLLPKLKMQRRAYILNVSSLCIFFYLPKKQVYGATKSFLYFFSKSLRRELKRFGISVSVLCPGGMNSNPSFYLLHRNSNRITRWASLNPEDVAYQAIEELLLEKERIIPGRWNQFFMWLDKILPLFIKNLLTDYQMSKLNAQPIKSSLVQKQAA